MTRDTYVARVILFVLFVSCIVAGCFRDQCFIGAMLVGFIQVVVWLLDVEAQRRAPAPKVDGITPLDQLEYAIKAQEKQLAELRSEVNGLNLRAGLGKKG